MSLYEQLNDLTTVARQRMVETFTGDALDTDRWSTDQLVGTADVADAIDGGLLLTTDGTSNAKITIAFNDIRQYHHSGCVFIGVFKFSATQATTIQTLGLSSADSNPRTSPQNAGLFTCSTGGTNYYCETGDGTSFGSTETAVSVDTDYHTGKLALDGTNVVFSVDGVLAISRSTYYPTAKMQPVIHLNSDITKTLNVNYVEAYNI